MVRLHTITSVHGEDGLRERLLIEAGRFPAADRARISAALAWMSRLHERDRRQREPYACHLLRVTIRILSHYRVTDANVACAALMHDAVEDHADAIASGGDREAALTVLARQFGARTAELVAAVTNPVYDPGRDEHEQYREHVTANLRANSWARAIKVSDFTDNACARITQPGPGLTGAKWGAIDLHGATTGLIPRSKYEFELLFSHDEPYWPTSESSFASRDHMGQGRKAVSGRSWPSTGSLSAVRRRQADFAETDDETELTAAARAYR